MKENGVQSSTESSTISYSNVVIPEGITNKLASRRYKLAQVKKSKFVVIKSWFLDINVGFVLF